MEIHPDWKKLGRMVATSFAKYGKFHYSYEKKVGMNDSSMVVIL